MKEKFVKVNGNNFQSEVLAAPEPVLVVYVKKIYGFEENLKTLQNMSAVYKNRLKICIVEDDFSEEFVMLNIEGSPTYIGFLEGREKGRIFGSADEASLESFILKTFPGIDAS